jgi:hypothetical protein
VGEIVGWGVVTITTGDKVGRGEDITILLVLGACDGAGNGNKVGIGVGDSVGEDVGEDVG